MSDSSQRSTVQDWVKESFSDSAQSVIDLLSNPSQKIARYGRYDLRRGDYDAHLPSSIFEEGREIGLAAADGEELILPGAVFDPTEEQAPTVSLMGYVTSLQQDLMELGFNAVREADGYFGPHTERALREFQIYAGMDRVAQEDPEAEGEYVDRLTSIELPPGSAGRYAGAVTGAANKKTRACLTHWINEGYRCPVVVTARTGDGYASVYDGSDVADGADPENVWRHDDVPTTACRMFAHDFTHYFLTPSETRPGSGASVRPLRDEQSVDLADEIAGSELEYQRGDRITLGYYVMNDEDKWYGPRTVPRYGQTWDSTEIAPELFGTEEDSMYSVIEAVTVVECQGYLDSLNAYDEALLSAGPYHWTMPRYDKKPIWEGELCGFLSYLKSEYGDTYDHVFGRFGVDVDTKWGESGEALFEGQQKYTASIEKQTDNGMEAMPTRSGKDPLSEEEAGKRWDYLRNWHWYYRFLMASRLQRFPGMENSFQEACYDYARTRVEDILSVEWEVPSDHWSASWPGDTTIGDVFTSEKAVAMLLRWHVFSPASFIDTSGPYQDENLTTILERARERFPNPTVEDGVQNVEGGPWTCDPENWTDEHENALIRHIQFVGEDEDNNLGGTLGDILEESQEKISVIEQRDSFHY